MSIGERIAEERNRLGFTQVVFAEKLGISISSQRRYEANERAPNIHYINALEKVSADVAYIMTGSRSPNEKLRFYNVLDRQTAELLVLFALQLDKDGFADAIGAISYTPGTPEFLRSVLDALIDNSPPLHERLAARKRKSSSAKKRIIK